MKVAYPASHLCDKLSSSLLALKIARHSPCTLCGHCPGLHPPPRVAVVLDEHSDSTLGTLEQYGSDDDDEEVSSYLDTCACGHGVKAHNADEIALGKSEFARRGRVAIRLDEVLQVNTSNYSRNGVPTFYLGAKIVRYLKCPQHLNPWMSGLGTPSGFHLYRRWYDLITEATRTL
jgi:hypothetical protein